MAGLDSRTVLELVPEINEIRDTTTREKVVEYWVLAYGRSAWSGVASLDAVPYNTAIFTASLVGHSRSVARTALGHARSVGELYGIHYDLDTLVAGAVLHDVCKLLESDPDPAHAGRAVKSAIGARLTHGVIGAYLARELELSLDVEHMILTHTPQSKTLPQTPEGVLVRHVDVMDADVLYGNDGLDLFLGRNE